jgi:hypothetical protein
MSGQDLRDASLKGDLNTVKRLISLNICDVNYQDEVIIIIIIKLDYNM